MVRLFTRLSLPLALLAAAPAQAQAPPPAPDTPRVVNVTTDSAPGWMPSEALERQAMATLDRFFAALDGGDDRGAYAMMSEINRTHMPFAEFAAENSRFRAQAGALGRRRVLKLTWTKDPAQAPYPGVYAAIDVAAVYANVERQCGYVILYQRPAGGEFSVMRIESAYIDNATAADIERTRSRAALDEMWASLARNCPNYQAEGR